MDSSKVNDSVEDMEDGKFRFVDAFDVTSGKLVIGDPLLNGNKVISNVANGEWYADVVKSKCGKFNAELYIYLADEGTRETDDEVQFVEDLIVDTGTMSIFCDSSYDEASWLGDFDMLADMLDNEDRAGGAPGGVACMSGFGDGNYIASVVRDLDGEAVSVCVYFMNEDEVDTEDSSDEPKVNAKGDEGGLN